VASVQEATSVGASSLTVQSAPIPSLAVHEQVERILVCPACRSPFAVVGADLCCTNGACGFVGLLAHDVVVLGDRSVPSFFDERHEVMTAGKSQEGVRCLCYEDQSGVVEGLLAPGQIVLDVGCGPVLPYEKPPGAFVIGLDASYESILANRAVDLRVYGSALAVPLPDRSVDLALAFYAVHHMTGQTLAENVGKLGQAITELGRVVKPGGQLLVFEVSPWGPAWLAERLLWNTARKLLGPKLDMCFYTADIYERVGRAALPHATFSIEPFSTSMLSTFPPAFSLPWLPIPRFLYPFDVNLYRWRL
jgi:ubiquinone/menaquinone biosynthesis C-methylase UbiE